MAWADRADRVLSAAIREFGQAVTFTPDGGSPESVTGVFDASYQLVTLGEDVEVDAVGPVLGIRIADYSAIPEAGDAISVGGGNYTVRAVHPDGHGGARLVLREA